MELLVKLLIKSLEPYLQVNQKKKLVTAVEVEEATTWAITSFIS